MAFPAAGFFSSGTTNVLGKGALDDFLAATKQLPGGAAEAALVIASGVVTPTTSGAFTVDTEGAVATDILDTIAQTNFAAGAVIVIRNADNARVVTVNHGAGGAGQILLADELDLVLDDTDEVLVLRRVSNAWEEVWRSHRNRLGKVINTLADSGTPYELEPSDHDKTVTNNGAVADVYVNLPPAAVGMRFRAFVVTAQALRLVADGVETIVDAATTGGYASMAGTVGNWFVLECLVASTWHVVGKNGTLTVA